MKTGSLNSKNLFPVIALLLLISCNSSEDKKTDQPKADTPKPATTAETKKENTPVTKPAIINILDTISSKGIVLYMKDSAASFERIGPKLGMIYGVKLADALKKSGTKMAGAPMAWYKTTKAPYFFEAGVAVNKKPSKLPKGVFIREMGTDSVVMAHFYGPYNLLPQGYDAIKERLKDLKRKSSGMPYEIYIGDPMDKDGKMIDPYKVRTDIVFPFK